MRDNVYAFDGNVEDTAIRVRIPGHLDRELEHILEEVKENKLCKAHILLLEFQRRIHVFRAIEASTRVENPGVVILELRDDLAQAHKIGRAHV